MELNKPIPPKLAQRFLNWFLRDDLAEEVQGDLEEQFYIKLEESTLFQATLNYWFQVINYLRPFAISKSTSTHLIHFPMLRNYFKISLRTLFRQKLYSTINIGGLTIGLTCFMIILLYVQNELSYNRNFADSHRIYRVYQQQPGNVFMGSDYFALTPAPLASALVETFPEIYSATTVQIHSRLLRAKDENFYQQGIWVDNNFFRVFPHHFIHGSLVNSLTHPGSIILTESLSKKLFGDRNPVGMQLLDNQNTSFTVTGVVVDPSERSTIKYSFISKIEGYGNYVSDIENNRWRSSSYNTYFMLHDVANVKGLNVKMSHLLEKEGVEDGTMLYAEPIREMYLHAGINFESGPKGNLTYLYLFSAIALITLLLACINYINLAIARSIGRSREVGLRKVIGGTRRQILYQFLGESIMIAFIALILSVGITILLLPTFSGMLGKQIQMDVVQIPYLLPGLVALVVIVGLISGSYPAFFLSSLRPAQVLKGKVFFQNKKYSLKKWLMISQFVISIIMIAGSFMIYRQLQYIQKKELGYDRDHVVVVNIKDGSFFDKYDVFKEQILKFPEIKAITASKSLPAQIRQITTVNLSDSIESADILIYEARVLTDYLKVFGIELLIGCDFSDEIISDQTEACLINESAMKTFGWSVNDVLGKNFKNDHKQMTVIGVVKDFHMQTLHLEIEPLMIRLDNSNPRYISAKMITDDISKTLKDLEAEYKKYSHYPFDFQFLDEYFDNLYQSEMKLGKIVTYFTVLSVLISAMGIFGLSAFSIEKKKGEISIRKVFGASMQNILELLTKDFLLLVMLASVFAIPIAWLIIDDWLQDFAYRITMEWWVFLLAASITVSITLMAISYQAVKAAIANPIKSLRSE